MYSKIRKWCFWTARKIVEMFQWVALAGSGFSLWKASVLFIPIFKGIF